MPSLSLTTNAPLSPAAEAGLTAALSKTLAAGLGKPEAYVMVSVRTAAALRFAGSDAPVAFLEVKSIGLPRDLNAVAEALTGVVSAQCGVPAGRIYATFTDVPPARWAHGGSTFA